MLVSLRPFIEKLSDFQPFYTDGMLLLTNYRLIFVSHRRLAFAGDVQDLTNDTFGDAYELSCEISLASIISISMSLQPDPSTAGDSGSRFLDALTIRTNDSKVRHTFEFSLSSNRISALSFITQRQLLILKFLLKSEVMSRLLS